jgi:hypothetical protein
MTAPEYKDGAKGYESHDQVEGKVQRNIETEQI